MPKLNVQQNNQNVIQAFKNALAIGNLKGIIASDGSHNFSTAGSNRNLLDNPWWGTNESVNQRGVTSGNGGYFVDRWNFSLPGTASVTWSTDENGFTGTTTTNFIITHKITNVTELGGKTLTASVMLSDGTIHSGTIVRNNATAQEFFRNSNPTWVVLMDSDNSFRIRVFNGTLSIRAVKLELGSVSTLANDGPPDYWQELDKCLYYFERVAAVGNYSVFGGGFAETATSGNIQIPIHPKRISNYTISSSGSFALYNGAAIRPVTNIAKANNNLAQNALLVNVTSSNLTIGGYYSFMANNSTEAYIDIYADL